MRALPVAAAVTSALTACGTDDNQGREFGLASFDGASEGAPIDEGVPYFSFSIRPTVAADAAIEVISAEVDETEGPVRIDAVLILPPDHPQHAFTSDERETDAFLQELERSRLTELGGCGLDRCEVVVAVVARRIGSDEPGVVRGVTIRYRTDGREFVERTTFAIGLCLPAENFCV